MQAVRCSLVQDTVACTIYKLSADLSVLRTHHKLVDQTSEIRVLSLTNGDQLSVVYHDMGCQ